MLRVSAVMPVCASGRCRAARSHPGHAAPQPTGAAEACSLRGAFTMQFKRTGERVSRTENLELTGARVRPPRNDGYSIRIREAANRLGRPAPSGASRNGQAARRKPFTGRG